MQALVKARSKLSPWRRSRRIPGRFWRSQFGGKCWIARSWSVRKRMMFIPATSLRLPFARGSARSTPAPWESSSAPRPRSPPTRAAACGSARPSRLSESSMFLLVGPGGPARLPGDPAEDRDRVALSAAA